MRRRNRYISRDEKLAIAAVVAALAFAVISGASLCAYLIFFR